MVKGGVNKKLQKNIVVILIIVLVIGFIGIMIFTPFKSQKQEISSEKIREHKFAGEWYPGDKFELSKSLKEYFEDNEKLYFNGKVKAVIVPHAGYIYSGEVAASAFNQLEETYETVFLLGPSHNYPLKDVSISGFEYFSTPLGKIKVSDKAKSMLNSGKMISNIEEAHENEHSLEIELPFLQYKLNNFEIVPLLVGETDSVKLKEEIMKYLGENDLIVVSVDLSHYHPHEEAMMLDAYSIDNILRLDSQGILDAEIDAPWAVSSLLEIAKENYWTPYLVSYSNSGKASGDMSSVVGYAAIVFVDENYFSADEKKFMLELSRKSIENYLEKGSELVVDEKDVPEKLKEQMGCFVTYSKNSQLRGCIGNILPQSKIYKCIIENSVKAALEDIRFPPIKKEELKEVEMSISILSEPVFFGNGGGIELLELLSEGEYGVILMRGESQGTFLPSVWETIPDEIDFLENLCLKSGMEKSCWTDTETEIYIYNAEDFSE